MGTRSFIIAKLSDGSMKAVYCHWDGYPDHHGPLLLDNYQDQAKIDALIAEGDLSTLGPNVGKKHPSESRDSTVCTFYGRDRGETDIEPREATDLAATVADSAESGAEFVYVWDGQAWGVTTPERGLPAHSLREYMKGELLMEQTVKAFGGNCIIAKVITHA